MTQTCVRPSDLARAAAGDLAELARLAEQHRATLADDVANFSIAQALGLVDDLATDQQHAELVAQIAGVARANKCGALDDGRMAS